MSRIPHLSSRLQGFGTTIFAEMSALATAHDAVNLGQGFPDFAAPPALKEAAAAAIAADHNQYAPGIGIPRLRKAIAGHAVRHHGLAYAEDTEITVTTGATEAIFASLQALLDVGDEVLLFEPYYDSYLASVCAAGAVPVTVPLRPDGDGVWRFDADALAAAVGPRTRLLVLNSPHNPCGKVYTRDELELIAGVARAHDLIVLSDEVYEHLTFGDATHVSIASLPGMHQRTVRISSAGKTFSVTGWKVGWICAPAALTAAVRTAKQFVTFTSGTPFQHAVAEALTWGEEYFAGYRSDYTRRRDLLLEALDDVGFRVLPPEGTYFIATDIRPLGFDDGDTFCRMLPGTVGVAAVPMSAFHRDPAAGAPYVRFAFCKTDELLAEGARRLKGLR